MFILKRNFLKQGEVQCTFGGNMMTTYLIIILVILIGYYVFIYFRQKAFTIFLSHELFIEGYCKAHLFVVREPFEFESVKIRWSRNITLSQLKQRLVELIKDKPVYLYCQNNNRSQRAAAILHKNKYEDINVLKGGFRKWTGKIDKK